MKHHSILLYMEINIFRVFPFQTLTILLKFDHYLKGFAISE